jgi:hypothetical protein
MLFLKLAGGCLLLFYCSPIPANAGPFSGAWGLVQFSSTANNGYPPLEAVCSRLASCSGTITVYGTVGLNMSYDVYGSATYGILRGYASESIAGSIQSGAIDPNMYIVANGQSYFDDTLTVFGGQSGTVGTLTVTFTTSGTSSSNGGFAGPAMWVFEGPSAYPCSAFTGAAITCHGIPITFEKPVDILFQMNTVLNVYDFAAGSSATADYSHSSVLTGIALNDSAGNLVSNFSIQSSSGTQYTSDGVVPEPSAFSLASTAIGLWAFLLMRRAKRAHSDPVYRKVSPPVQ